MAQLGVFDPTAVVDDRPELLPVGKYVAQITDSDVVATKSGTGTMLKLTLEVLDGPLARRKVFDQLNIENANPQAQQIGQRQLSRICKALGINQAIQDSEVLHFKPMVISVGVEEDKSGQYGPQNRIRNYEAVITAQAFQPAPATPQQAATAYQAPQQAPAGRPWATSR